MVGYIEMQYPTTVIAENDEHKKDFETGGWDREKIERDELFGMILQEVCQCCDGGPRCRIMYFDTVASETSMPSFRSSPCIRGAPQSGLAEHILRISCLISPSILGRPRFRLFQRQ